jgi:hypothetical protein
MEFPDEIFRIGRRLAEHVHPTGWFGPGVDFPRFSCLFTRSSAKQVGDREVTHYLLPHVPCFRLIGIRRLLLIIGGQAYHSSIGLNVEGCCQT